MTDDKILDIFQAHGQYATGKDYAMIHAIAEAVSQQRKPLTDEQIYSITGVENRDEMMHRMARNIARAIEAAHNIKE